MTKYADAFALYVKDMLGGKYVQEPCTKRVRGKIPEGKLTMSKLRLHNLCEKGKEKWVVAAAAKARATQEMQNVLLGKPQHCEVREAAHADAQGAAENRIPENYEPISLSFQGGRIRTERLLGKGAYGEVHRGRDDCGRPFAVKVATVDPAINDLAVENSILANLRGPGLVTSYGLAFADTVGAKHTMGMMLELADTTLQELLLELPFSPCARWKMSLQLLRAADYIHSCQILHLDIKPNNILAVWAQKDVCSCPNLKLADFGMAADTNSDRVLRPGVEVFTVPYRPVECQLAGRSEVRLSAAADLWALGCVIFQVMVEVPRSPSRLFTVDSITNLTQSIKAEAFLFKLRDKQLERLSDDTHAQQLIQGLVCPRQFRLCCDAVIAICLERMRF
ncbi:crk1 [Symbiodinium sp. CCMP2592]|nr:crk1 [Symbiodinium sp. CCMP2592]